MCTLDQGRGKRNHSHDRPQPSLWVKLILDGLGTLNLGSGEG